MTNIKLHNTIIYDCFQRKVFIFAYLQSYMTEIMLDKQETLNEIGYRIRRLRESKNLSIQDFADKLEIEYNNVIRIEKGRTNFTIGTLVKIANTLEVNLKDIV